jgi:hypothetical protein
MLMKLRSWPKRGLLLKRDLNEGQFAVRIETNSRAEYITERE